jgi:hypothetical protein
MFPYMTHLVCDFVFFSINLNKLTFFFIEFRNLKEFNKSLLYLCVTGPNAVEFIINHAEVSIAFVQQSKIPSVSSILFLGAHSFTF